MSSELYIKEVWEKSWSFERPRDWELADKKYDRAVDKMEAKKFNEAIRLYEEILNVFPNHLDARHNLGCIYDWQNEMENAYKHWSENVKNGRLCLPDNFIERNNTLDWHWRDNHSFLESLKMIGVYLKEVGLIDNARKIFEELLKLNPKDNQGVKYLIEELEEKK